MRIFLILLFTACSFFPALTQSINFRELFGDSWKKAENFEMENRKWMEPLLAENNISYPLAISVIFPELVRYSALRDKMEVTLLKALYINLGDEYANFSVGQFQMKPSFAELVREKIPSVRDNITGISFKPVSDYDNISYFRKSIVTDLEDPVTQFKYLIVFLKISEKKFKTNRKDEFAKVRFLATAYNYGFGKSAKQIESMIDKKFFNTKLFKTENYCYADVSLYWYNQYKAGK